MVADAAIRQKRLQRNRSRANNAQGPMPELSTGKARQIQLQNDSRNVEVARPSSRASNTAARKHVKTTPPSSSSSSSSSSRGKERQHQTSIPSSLPGEPRSSAEQRYFDKHNQLSSSSSSRTSATPQQSKNTKKIVAPPPQSRNDNDSSSWFQYTNGTNMRSTTTPQKRQQQQQQQKKPTSNNTTTNFDSSASWASFSESPFDNSFSSGGNPFSNKGALEWPTDDGDDDDDGIMDVTKKLNTNNSSRRIQGKILAEVKSVAAAAAPIAATKTITKTSSVAAATKTITKTSSVAARRTTSQSKPRPPQKEIEAITNDDEVEFWGVESDEVTNLTGLNNDDYWGGTQPSADNKESDVAALFKYRNGVGKGSRNEVQQERKKATVASRSSPGKLTTSSNQVSPSKLTTATSSQQALGTTAKLKSFYVENNQQQQQQQQQVDLSSKPRVAVTSTQKATRFSSETRNGGSSSSSVISQIKEQQQPSSAKLSAATSTRSDTPTSAIGESYYGKPSPAQPMNLDTNRFKSLPSANSNSHKTTPTSVHSTSPSPTHPSLPPSPPSSTSFGSSNKASFTGNSLSAYKKFGSRSSLPQQQEKESPTTSSVAAAPPPPLSPLSISPPTTQKKKLGTASYLVTPERNKNSSEDDNVGNRFGSSLLQQQLKTVTPSPSRIHTEQPSLSLHSSTGTVRDKFGPSVSRVQSRKVVASINSPPLEVSSQSLPSKVTKPEVNKRVVSNPSTPQRFSQRKAVPSSSFRKRTLPPKPYIKPSSPSKSNSSIVIKNGGTPVWVNTSIFNEGKHIDAGVSWNWVRAYLSAAADDSMDVIVDDPTSKDYNGKSYTISKCYNDGERILMGNTWWSSPSSVDEPGHSMPPEDLVELTHLHEPAIVCALEARYLEDIIYTNTGSILLAVNPFKKIDNLYTREMMERYWNHEHGNNAEVTTPPPPHAFAVAELAFSSMMRSLEERDADALSGPLCNQSILVSGESGAGKTVNTKIVMRYLTLLSQRHMRKAMSPSRTDKECLNVETQVLQSNPILESFGNARTIRNDNSSRFGKFIEMSFQAQRDDPSCSRGTLLGASIDFYLLEKVRLVSVNPGERNYHVFYEITCPRGMSMKEKKRYKLTSSFGKGDKPLTAEDFNMTSISGTFDRRDGVVDMDTYRELRMAMDSVGFVTEEQESIFRVTAALLHASNLRFESRGSDDCFLFDGDGTLDAVADLLGVSVQSLQTALTSRVIEARGEVLVKRLSLTQATKALEALTKATYGALFEYIVKRINQSIEAHGDADDFELNKATIGVLDIFGFESFQTNSFEQLCINYCNEALQQQFAKFVFKAEQAEYEVEGIGWSNIDFPDNQDRLDLIDAKRVGIFSVLDEQCRLPMRTDQTFAKAVHDSCEKNEFYAASQIQQSKGSFAIVHYAGEVEYDSSGFIVKNKDELPKSTFDLLSSSSVALLSELACILERSDDAPATSSVSNSRAPVKRSSSTLARATVSGQFSSQLRVLRSRIELTEPHYIRCLKPNDRLVADSFDHSLISHQLNCAGVLPAMKIARAGFAMRYPHTAFDQRFSPIVNKQVASLSYRSLKQADRSKKLVGLLALTLEAEMKKRLGMVDGVDNVVSWGVQIGKTKVFLRAAAFDALEELRYSALNKAATIIQANARAFLEQNRLLLQLGSILTLQCVARKMIATIFVRKLRFHRKVISIQTQWRSYSAWFSYQNLIFITVWCQRFWRGKVVRRDFISIMQQMETKRTVVVETKQVKSESKGANVQKKQNKSVDRDDKIHLLSEECAKKDRELEMLRQEVDCLRDRSVTTQTIPTMPSTISISPTSRSSAFGVPFLPSDTSNIFRDTPNMPSSNLLDDEVEGLPDLEYSRISRHDSHDNTFEKGHYSSFNLSIESSFMDSSTSLPFHRAVKSNNYKLLLDEIKNASSDIETSINSVDSKGRTPLHVAVQHSNLEMAKVLLSNHAIVNTQDFVGNTALHYADSPDMGLLLLEKGSSPNIPNGKGLCSLHLAVQRRDFASVKLLLSHGADVNNADDECWYTSLHLISHPEESFTVGKKEMSLRGPIAELLCEAKSPSVPDLNYQDRDGNTPLHHAASLAEEDAGLLISVFIEHGSCPKIANNRGQTPVHLFCHNNAARGFIFYHEALHLMLAKGASPNHQSLSGCTALHLALYHQDVEAAAILVRYGAQLNTPWKKPLKWNAFWIEVGPDDVVLPLDMLEDVAMLHRVLSEVSSTQITAPRRQKCMHCKLKFGVFNRHKHCANCGRSVCGRCAKGSLKTTQIPSLRNNDESTNPVCILCEHILFSKANDVPTAVVSGGGEGSVIAGSIISAVSF